MPQPARAVSFVLLVFLVTGVTPINGGSEPVPEPCPSGCSCAGYLADCSGLKHGRIAERLPARITRLDLSHNKLRTFPEALLASLPQLSEIKLSNNEFESIPDLGPNAGNLSSLILANNRISRISAEQLSSLVALETLDLSNNNIMEVRAGAFPPLPLKNLLMNNNRISTLEHGCFSNLSSSLLVLKLNKNRLSSIPPKIFPLPHLQHLELSRNRVRRIEGLTFQGLHGLRSLKIQRNGVTRLMDGAFWGLNNMEVLQLEYNNLTEVSKGWLYGLLTLQQLHLSHNTISRIKPDAWEFCQKLAELDLSWNQLSRLEESSFVGLGVLEQLHIGNNRISFIADGAFRGLPNLQALDLKYNEISWTIEDMNGPFSALDNLRKLFLQGNRIRSVTRKSFTGLDLLEQLDLSNNAIMSVQANAFSQMKKLSELYVLLPYFTKMPMDLTIRAGATARLECAASGHPSPQIAWQKDGGTDFPAARERRMHVMPRDDVFFIVDVKTEDIGVYSCTAQNTAGAISANATLTVLETPSFLRPLMDRVVVKGETAVLQCIAGGSPPPRLNWTKDDSPLQVTERHFFAAGNQLLIIDDETNLPADIPSYLSSQGTLAERQDGFMASESGSSHQYISSSTGGFYMPPKDLNSLCQLDTGSDADMEAAIDPLLCHYQGPVGSLLRRSNRYSPDLHDSCSACASVGAASSCSRKCEFYTCSSALEPFDHMMMQLGDTSCVEDCESGQCVLGSSGSYMGTFGKAAWRPQQELCAHNAVILQENPYAALHADSDLDEEHASVYQQPLDHRTIESVPTSPLGS
ncbi:leucine-rich repeats and immunoglobulin-like domains protein 3 [Sinocyclocheilus grahami]|nr:PREDICTED: leucine-rich repeats and immunoglobulin-like domains protein 3 [Sinocyclocheilus grahami]